MDDAERWLPVRGYEGLYEVSDLGRVRSIPRTDRLGRQWQGRLRIPSIGRNGRPGITLSLDGEVKTVALHILVARAFAAGEADGLVVCHNDGDSSNNAASNLRWDTVSSNNFDAVLHGVHHNASKTHCPQGHEYTPENTYSTPVRNHRDRCCRTCRREAVLRFHAKRRLQSAPIHEGDTA